MNRFRFTLALATLAAAVMLYHRTPLINWAADAIIEARLESAIAKIKHTPFNELVSADIARQAAKGRSLYTARAAFFDEYLCGPVFSDSHNDRGRCFDILYAGAYEPDVRYQYGKHGVPSAISPLIAQFRAAAMQSAREYLADPVRLTAFYEARKHLAVDYIIGLDAAERTVVTERLAAAHTAFTTFYDPKVQEAYALYIASEREHEWTSLSAVSPDPAVTLFAGRRANEDGRPLVEAYAAITADLLASVIR